MSLCAVCTAVEATRGYLCDDCIGAISGGSSLFPEQVQSEVRQTVDAAIVDRFGRAHALAERTLIGRQAEPNGIGIVEASVSRRHAEILRKADGGWWIVDLASTNGTTLREELVTGSARLRSGDVIFVGQVGFFFIAPAPVGRPRPPALPATHRPPVKPEGTRKLERLYDTDEDDEDTVAKETSLGLRVVDLTLASPGGGGGGVLVIDGQSVQLTDAQFELVRLLATRMFEEQGRDERVRGFVRSSELLASLPWDTGRPEDNHMKQLVRRVRQAMIRGRMGDLIESRHGFGYRLRVRPARTPVQRS